MAAEEMLEQISECGGSELDMTGIFGDMLSEDGIHGDTAESVAGAEQVVQGCLFGSNSVLEELPFSAPRGGPG